MAGFNRIYLLRVFTRSPTGGHDGLERHHQERSLESGVLKYQSSLNNSFFKHAWTHSLFTSSVLHSSVAKKLLPIMEASLNHLAQLLPIGSCDQEHPALEPSGKDCSHSCSMYFLLLVFLV